MSALVLLFGLFSGCFLAVCVGLIGKNRNIGFALSFILSLIFTPLVGLIITLLSSKKEVYEDRSLGCLGTILGIVGLLILITFILMVIGVIAVS